MLYDMETPSSCGSSVLRIENIAGCSQARLKVYSSAEFCDDVRKISMEGWSSGRMLNLVKGRANMLFGALIRV